MKLKEYFTNQNYTVLYTYTFFNKFASALVNFFTGAFFFSLGMPLYLILLFFGLEFGTRGLFAPLGPKLVSTHGIIKSMLISNTAFIIFFIFIGLGQYSLYLAFFAFIFHALASGLYTTITEGLQSKLIENKNRGKQQSLTFILQSIAGLIGIIIGATMLEYYSYWIITIIAGFSIVTSTLSFLFIKNISFKTKFTYRETFSKLFSEEYEENRLPIFGQALAIIANATFVPIFIFMQVESFKLFGIIMFIVFFIEAFLILVFGRILDKKDTKKLNKKTATLNGIGNIGLLIFAKNPFTLMFANSYNQISWNLYHGNALVRQLNKAKNHSFLFMTLIQMNLCFVEFFALVIFALMAFLYGDTVSYIIFFSSIIGIFLFSNYFKD